jgi:hypothetical protein
MEDQQPWFHNHMSKVHQFDTSSSALDQTIIYTSNLSSYVPVRDMTAEELAEHVLNISENTEETLASKNSRMRRGLFQETRKEVFHGFVVVPQSM